MRAAQISVERLSAPFGVEISGINLALPMDSDAADCLRASLWQHGLLVFRNQMLSAMTLRRFMRDLGLAAEGDAPLATQHITDQDYLALQTDAVWKPQPPVATLLYAETVPVEIESIFVSRQAAYHALSQPMRLYLDEMSAIHDAAALWSAPGSPSNMDLARMISLRRNCPLQQHALRRDHPITGVPSLCMSTALTTQLVGVEDEESEAILAMLREVMSRPALQSRLTWRNGTLVLWDNIVAQHHVIGAPARPDFSLLQMEGNSPRLAADPAMAYARIC